ncbi:VOC family protein [Leifsonia sp. NPDC056824]|uniref:VOC family protein n=1 Tax=Leifsonia sp. NPDC056824 TaxID=3345953 RepID=UPI00368BC91D
MQTVRTFLWYDGQAEAATEYYASLVPDSRILRVDRLGEDGSTVLVTFELGGIEYVALDGGPLYSFTEAASIMVVCEDQAEVDRLWDGLTADGGEPGPCGWLKDRWGLSWQIVPRAAGVAAGPRPRACRTRERRDAHDGQARHRRTLRGGRPGLSARQPRAISACQASRCSTVTPL